MTVRKRLSNTSKQSREQQAAVSQGDSCSDHTIRAGISIGRIATSVTCGDLAVRSETFVGRTIAPATGEFSDAVVAEDVP
jgi:hypothetical protein